VLLTRPKPSLEWTHMKKTSLNCYPCTSHIFITTVGFTKFIFLSHVTNSLTWPPDISTSSFKPFSSKILPMLSEFWTSICRECHGFSNPMGFAMGFSGVQIWVGNSIPHPYLWHRFWATPTMICHMHDLSWSPTAMSDRQQQLPIVHSTDLETHMGIWV